MSLACPQTKTNLMSLIEDGKTGQSISCRGGYGSSYYKFVFIKMKPGQLTVYRASGWDSIPKSGRAYNDPNHENTYGDPPIAWITKDNITMRTNPDNVSRWAGLWELGSFLSLGEYDSDGRKIIPVKIRWTINKNYFDCNNGKFLPQKKMVFNWDGDLINATKANIKATYDWLESLRIRRNNMAKRNRKERKAVAEFRYRRDEGMLDDWDASKALSFKNAQLRQQAIEEVGLNRVIGHLPSNVLDTDTIDKRPYELVQFLIPNENFDSFQKENQWNRKTIKATYLKMTNPSTGEYHLEGIPLQEDNTWDYAPEATVKCALAWRDGEVSGRETDKEWTYTKPQILT